MPTSNPFFGDGFRPLKYFRLLLDKSTGMYHLAFATDTILGVRTYTLLTHIASEFDLSDEYQPIFYKHKLDETFDMFYFSDGKEYECLILK